LIKILQILIGRNANVAVDGESPGAAFLRRRNERLIEHEIKRRTVLGFVLGGALLIISFAKLYLTPTNLPELFMCLGGVGLVLLIITLIIPQLLFPIDASLRLVGGKVGELMLSAILGAVYLAIITPIGLLIRSLGGASPIYQWSTSPPHDGEGWSVKSVSTLVRGRPGIGGSRTGVISVIAMFVKRGKVLLLPAVVTLIAFGLAFYFVKTSVLAPFIYTLF
jgi:hypothetical protein